MDTKSLIQRKKTVPIRVGSNIIGGDNPVSIQSMTNTRTEDHEATIRQITELAEAGCDIVRCAIPNQEALDSFKSIRRTCKIPLVADIHFSYELAIKAIEAGADKVRINPGNIGSIQKVNAIIDAAKNSNIPIRIGVNSGSLEQDIYQKYSGPTPEALVASALNSIHVFEDRGFGSLVVSLKAADVWTTIHACRLFSQKSDYPLHIGITESGTLRSGTIRSSVGMAILLSEGIGDTLRISLSAPPIEEVHVATEILKSLGHRTGPTVIACPTCGRTDINVSQIAEHIESLVSSLTIPIKIAVMGCVVNGPGEAREADIGIAGGNGSGVLFMKGKEIKRVPEDQLIAVLWEHIQMFNDEYAQKKMNRVL